MSFARPFRPKRPLLVQARDDPEAFGRFYDRNSDRVLVYLTRHVFEAETAFDLMSETFAKAFERRAQFRGSSEAEGEGWLFAIARNELLTYFRRGGYERDALARLGVPPVSLSDEDIERIEDLADIQSLADSLQEALQRLPADQVVAVQLRVVEGADYSDIAAQLSISEQTVRARVSRGLRTLGLWLAEDTTIKVPG